MKRKPAKPHKPRVRKPRPKDEMAEPFKPTSASRELFLHILPKGWARR